VLERDILDALDIDELLLVVRVGTRTVFCVRLISLYMPPFTSPDSPWKCEE
jgi:hypothetical protein